MRLSKIISTSFLLFGFVLATASIPTNDIDSFKKELVEKFKFKATEVDHALKNAKFNEKIINTMNTPYEDKSYTDYRRLFITPKRISEGQEFYKQNKSYLNKISKQYGVAPEIIVAIIGIESNYGKRTTHYSTLDSLYTLAFYYPKRAKFFRYELTQFLILCRELGRTPESVYGSYAGALGIPQFMPSSYRHYALSTINPHKPNLFDNKLDAMASIGNYLNHFGWVIGQTPAVMLDLTNRNGKRVEFGKVYTAAELKTKGITPKATLGDKEKGKLLQIDEDTASPTTWMGLANFDVIKKYNKSNLYALAVTELAEGIKTKS
jgi:membrane-bound lytic murein transglycosylase B